MIYIHFIHCIKNICPHVKANVHKLILMKWIDNIIPKIKEVTKCFAKNLIHKKLLSWWPWKLEASLRRDRFVEFISAKGLSPIYPVHFHAEQRRNGLGYSLFSSAYIFFYAFSSGKAMNRVLLALTPAAGISPSPSWQLSKPVFTNIDTPKRDIDYNNTAFDKFHCVSSLFWFISTQALRREKW